MSRLPLLLSLMYNSRAQSPRRLPRSLLEHQLPYHFEIYPIQTAKIAIPNVPHHFIMSRKGLLPAREFK